MLPLSSPSMIRPLTPADAATYRTVRLRALWEQPPAFGSMPMDEPDTDTLAERLMPSRDGAVFGAFENEQLVGILKLTRSENPSERHRASLTGLYVMPSFRKQGLGRALVTTALAHAKTDTSLRRLTLGVVTTQEFALRLFESLGFHRHGLETESFSSAGVFHDEHLMSLDLNEFQATPHNPPHLNYRYATEHDCSLLAELNHQLILESGDPHPMKISEFRQQMRTWLTEGYRAVLFETQGSLTAYVLYRIHEDTVFILQFYITPSHRRMGLDQRAIELLQTEILPAGSRFKVKVPAEATQTAAFWRSLGYRDLTLILEK